MTPMTIAPVLREVAELRIDEFDRSKQSFKSCYGVGIPRPSNITLHERISTLVRNIQLFDSDLEEDNDLTVIARYIDQTEDGRCISNERLLKFEAQILEKLRKRMNRYETTSLHLDLMREAMDGNPSATLPSAGAATTTFDDDDFEVVDNRLGEVWGKFETETFTAKDVDTEALEVYLTDLMRSHGSLHRLTVVRDNLRRYGNEILEGDTEFEEDELEWCIMDLLKNDLISHERRESLQSLMQNSVALKELLGLLNTKSVRRWNWKYTDKGLPVTACQDADGRYHVTVEEDLVDMVFLHYTAIGWAKKLKECLSDVLSYLESSDKRCLSLDNDKERSFFLEMMPFEPPKEPSFDSLTHCSQPLPPIPPDPYHLCIMPGKPKKKKKFVMPPPPPPPPMMVPPPPPLCFISTHTSMRFGSVDEERHKTYMRESFLSRFPTQDGCRPKVVSIEEVQTNLIKTLTIETKLRTAFDGTFGCSVVDFHSLVSALPHKTIIAVLNFLGVPEIFIDFFARFLSANLNIGPSVRGTPDRILTRACGVPKNHGLELLFTESILFFAELAVNRKTGGHLHRLGARCYFVGTEEQNDQAIQELSVFSEHTNLEFDDVLTQPEHLDIGFLELARDVVIINSSKVETYAHHVKKQLSAQATVYDWVRVWNSTMGTYASHLFGPLVELFGRSHVEAVKSAYRQIFDVIFDGGTLTDRVQHMLRTRSDFASSCSVLALEAIIHLPQAFGSLGVKNPFVTLNLARNINPDPNTLIKGYLDAETNYYEAAMKNWSALTSDHVSKKLSSVFLDNQETVSTALGAGYPMGTFLMKARLTRHREYAPYLCLPNTLLRDVPPPPPSKSTSIPDLIGLYYKLLNAPVDNIIASRRVTSNVRDCGRARRWNQLDPQDKWMLQMYGDECFEQFGSLDVWLETFIPGICMLLVRGSAWEGGDDDESGSYMSSLA